MIILFFFFSSRRRHTRWNCDWSSDVCSSDLAQLLRRADREACAPRAPPAARRRRPARGSRRRMAPAAGAARRGPGRSPPGGADRKSTRLNSSHSSISYAVFCLKKKNLKLKMHFPKNKKKKKIKY